MKKFFLRLLVFIVIYLILTLITSMLLPNRSNVMDSVIFGVIIVISLAVTDIIEKKWSQKK